jgi:formate hydrogenlyase subunit 6/NADH:ubiquinone oxidoreductase subunit I
MLQRKFLQKNRLPDLLKKLSDLGYCVISPAEDGKRSFFEKYKSGGKTVIDRVQTTLSPKSVFFPFYQEVLRFRFIDKDVENMDIESESSLNVLFGCRPCDARAMLVQDSVFSGDNTDVQYFDQRKRTVVISMSCSRADEYCFCASTGGGPGDSSGSDILLTEADVGYLAEIITEKGLGIAEKLSGLWSDDPGIDKEKHLAVVKKIFDPEKAKKVMEKGFEGGLFIEQSLRCVGCGACAYVCPACTCFDLQDERIGSVGSRVKCWDSCGFSNFTTHTSGHNPREVQSARWRQRLMHKFSYQPETHGLIGCVGCGRCSRSCPVDLNILECLVQFSEAQ